TLPVPPVAAGGYVHRRILTGGADAAAHVVCDQGATDSRTDSPHLEVWPKRAVKGAPEPIWPADEVGVDARHGVHVGCRMHAVEASRARARVRRPDELEDIAARQRSVGIRKRTDRRRDELLESAPRVDELALRDLSRGRSELLVMDSVRADREAATGALV